MDAPGFPADPNPLLVLLVWLLPLVVVPAYFLALPAHTHGGTQTPDGVVECPLSGAAGSVMPSDPAGELYRFWAPCVTASRRDVGLSLRLYAVAAGAVGVVVLRAPRR